MNSRSGLLAASALMFALVACGGGSSSSQTPTPIPPTPTTPPRTVGFDVPGEISPVSTVKVGAFSAAIKALSSSLVGTSATVATDAGTDYSNAKTLRFVSEHSIDQFAIIETILNAISQTHYADAENINAGPYKSIVSWQENKQGSQGKTTQTWIVNSTIFQESGKDINRVQAWIDDGGPVIRAEFKISASATKHSDGSYQDYGQWSLNVKFDNAGTSFFVAQASLGSTGETVLTLQESQVENGNPRILKAVMHKADALGYGKVLYPKWDSGLAPTPSTVTYAYNAAQLRVQEGAQDVSKDRSSSVEITQRYGLYDAITGADVMKSHSFGFPVTYQAAGGTSPLYAYYGAWQGRHQLWSGSGQIPDGTSVTRQDRGNAAETYKAASFTGTLTKRTLVPADINDLLNIPSETWVNIHRELVFNGTAWTDNGQPYTDFTTLIGQPRKWVGINRWDNVAMQPRSYVYDPAGATGAGFYLATSGPNGQMVSTGQLYTPTLNDRLWVDVGGSIYIEFQGAITGWAQKKLTAFDQNTWTPTFDPAGDTPFTLELNRQFYINKQGGNYVVTRTGSGIFDVRVEIQTAANPTSASQFLSGVTALKPQNFSPSAPSQTSTYQFVTDAQSAMFLKLVYASVGTLDANASPAPKVGDVVSSGLWGLSAYDAGGASLGFQFNWDYPRAGETFGIQTFLYTDGGNGTRTYKLLDDPIALQPLPLTISGQSRTFSLQFDGWMHGLPDYSNELQRNNWVITDTVASKIINIAEGTAVTSSLDAAQHYLIKPLEIGLYMKVAATPDASLVLTQAQAIDLNSSSVIPAFVDPGMGTVPTVTTVKYSEGVKVP